MKDTLLFHATTKPMTIWGKKRRNHYYFSFVFFLFFSFFFISAHSHASNIADFLCELGYKYYNQGRLEDALREFKNVLLIDPSNKSALNYIQEIEKKSVLKANSYFGGSFALPKQEQAVDFDLSELIQIQQEFINDKLKPQQEDSRTSSSFSVATTKTASETRPKIQHVSVISLDGSLNAVKQPIELPQNESFIVKGNNITRFLVTQPEIVQVQKTNMNELLVTAKSIGYTYLHVWDNNGRWSLEISGTFPRIEGLTSEDFVRRAEERARNFKLRYSLDWSSFEIGESIDTLERFSYSWGHNIGLQGQSPYGLLDSSASIRNYNGFTDLTFFTLGLTQGVWGPFKDFSLRGFDFSPPISNLVAPALDLRGAIFTFPSFEKKLTVNTFWGREGGGRYGNLSPNLVKQKHSFIEGAILELDPDERQNYRLTALRGYGRDRADYLKEYGWDWFGMWRLGENKTVSYELGYDTEALANLFKWRFLGEKLGFSADYRHIDKDYKSIIGNGWDQGKIGWLFNLNYLPSKKINVAATLDLYRERLFPAEDKPKRWNEDFGLNTVYSINDNTSASVNYSIVNSLGRISQFRQQTVGAGINRHQKILGKDLSLYLDGSHQESIDFSSHATDYINDRIHGGFRINLIKELNYYANYEYNFLRQRFDGSRSNPNAFETGIDWRDQFLDTPFYGNFRFSYRNEEDCDADLSFLSGEDYIDGYSELAYRKGDLEVFGGCSFRNVWRESKSSDSRTEMNFNGGLRYIWDTGLSWEAVGNIEGYVFKDLNSDGLRQRDEPPIQGMKVFLGRDKSCLTDQFGYFNFKKVRAKKVEVSLDTSRLPTGFVLSVPSSQEITILHNRTLRVDFGITSRSEISGAIFLDKNEDGIMNQDESGIPGVVVVVDGVKKAVSDRNGRYIFSNLSVGEHILTLDLSSLPMDYLPTVPVKKEIILYEGITYIYNIPVRKTK